MGLASGDSHLGHADRHPLTGRPWRDNVPRKLAFEKANPDVEITPGSIGNRYTWTAAGRLANGDPVSVTAEELEDLLDQLGAA